MGMGALRWGNRRDTGSADLMRQLRECGFTVWDTSRCGEGAPDAVVGRNGITLIVEWKGPKTAVQANQSDWSAEWRGGPVVVARTLKDVLDAHDRLLLWERRRLFA